MTNPVPSSKTRQATTTKPCDHCGDPCEGVEISRGDKVFCCRGCAFVYELLAENDLCRYYELDENAGISLKGKRKPEYAYLDAEDIQHDLFQFRSKNESRVKLFIPQIHCVSCIWLLENLHKLRDGILNVRVNFSKREIVMAFRESEISLRDIVELLASIGYEPEIRRPSLQDSFSRSDKTLFIKIGIAGFAFGNIMLFSFPEYLGLEQGVDGQYARFFSALNLLLAFPVLFYSGWDYLYSAWQGIRHRFISIDIPIALGMAALFGRSVYEILTHTGAGYIDSLAGLVFFLLIGKWFQQRTFQHISFERDYKSYFPMAVSVRRENTWKPVPLHNVREGDDLLVKNGEIIAADGTLIRGEAEIDYSFVTGESEPVAVKKGERLYAGGRQKGGAIELAVAKKPSQSYLIQLWDDEAFTATDKTKASLLADRVGRYFTIVILVIAFSTLFYWLQFDTAIAVNAFTAVLIIACPCAVALSIPFTFGNVMRILASKGFFLKSIRVVERFRYITNIVVDKTGTLTRHVTRQVVFRGVSLSRPEKIWIKSMTGHSNHPVSRQIHSHFASLPECDVEKLVEIPGQGIEASIDGHLIRIGSPAFAGKNGSTPDTGTYIEIDGEVRGYFSIKSAYRKGMKEVLQSWNSVYDVSLLSGDDDREKPVFKRILGRENGLHFRMLPKDKLNYIKRLQADGSRVLMLGDGLNDAGALKQSDIGIVISEDLNNFSPACDAILDANQFERLPRMVRFAQKSMNLVFTAYGLAALYNIIGLSFAVQGLLSPVIAAILMPASSITIVMFGILSSNILAWKMQLAFVKKSTG